MKPNWTKTVSKKGLVFWRDNKTGLLWAPPLKDKYTYHQAVELKQEQFCGELGKFKKREWALPTREEIYEALAHGLLELEPKYAGWFWSASIVSYDRYYAWDFDSNGFVNVSSRGIYSVGVRCVGR